ncbi:MAG: hypothetical protein KDD70_05340 [Bdellovibrionales bacterium]|nr:hypothetical protein [Bdellovibrionales bacterium]
MSKKRSSGQTGAAMVEYIPMVALFILLTVTSISAVGAAIAGQFGLVGETVRANGCTFNPYQSNSPSSCVDTGI